MKDNGLEYKIESEDPGLSVNDKKNWGFFLKQHLVDTTAGYIVVTPLFSVLETTLFGLTDNVSIKAKLIGTGASYILFLGSAFSKLRDFTRKKFGVSQDSPRLIQGVHDTVCTWAYYTAITPLFYYASGSTNFYENARATALALFTGTFTGYPVGLAIDAYRDFAGIEESKRLPDLIKNQRPFVKKSMMLGLTVASTAFTIGYFYLRNYLGIDR